MGGESEGVTPLPPSDLNLLVRSVLRLSRAFHGALDEPLEAELNLNMKELVVLTAIADGGTYPSQIAARHHLPAPTVTRLLGHLSELGLVRRVTEPDDLRKFRLELTEEGEQTRDHTRAASERILHGVFGHLPSAALRRAIAALAELEAALQAEAAPRS